MSKKKKSKSGAAPSHRKGMTPQAAEPVAASRARTRSRTIVLVALVIFVCIGIVAYVATNDSPSTPPSAEKDKPAPAADYVGAKACTSCHAREYEAWRGSQHDLAMQHADDRSVLGNFDNAKFAYAGITSTFFKRDDKFYVNTDGPDGKLHDYELKYTFGVEPLQQYLVEFPDGRMQALAISWDSRPKDKGGQRWFHIYPGQAIKAGDRLHWTGIDMNWNHQCAECHSTNLRKNFDAKTNTFKTTWSEINVACEACHGPGSAHVTWANKQGDWKNVGGKGLVIALDERHGVAWKRKEGDETAERNVARTTSREIDTCARCHARRGTLAENYTFGRALADTHRAALLTGGLYWPDGQMRDEVYNYASFLQSEMYAKGVTCSDCHDPHTMKRRKPGNDVCTQCHEREHFDNEKHTHHKSGSEAAQCPACHMPTTTYMVVDPRHDHSMRVPRPDRTITMGTPNACNQCHQNRSAQWSADAIRKWEKEPAQGFQKFAEALHAGNRNTADARSLLMAVIDDPKTPSIARASTLALLARYPAPSTFDVERKALNHSDPLVRATAAEALGGAPAAVRIQSLPRLLNDPVLLVRISAARSLAAIPPDQIPAEQRAALGKGIDEYVATQRMDADRPESHSNLGALFAERGQFDQAQAEFKQALVIDPAFVPAAANLADLERARGDERAAEATLRAALKLSPKSAPLHHALGLSLVRQKQTAPALGEFSTAARLAPDNAGYAYVHGVALHSTGKAGGAITVLTAAHRRFSGDTGILQALATMERDRGNREAALAYAKSLVALTPDDPQAQALLQQVQR
ncbi:MAG: tetratricopeptide repeat protein [Betaproteobacteria bacterium]